MAQGDSIISICNTALMIHLGENPIVSLTDNTRVAQLCALRFHPVRRRVLRLNPWRCATAQAALAASVSPPLFDFDNAYPLPADFVRMKNLPTDDVPRWKIVGNQIFSDDGPPLNIEYIFDLQDTTAMDAGLVDTLAVALAEDLVMALTQSVDKFRVLQERMAQISQAAESVSSQEASPKELDDDILLRSRA